MTENLMTKLNAEDTTLLVKLSQARGDDSLSKTITDLIEDQYSQEVFFGKATWEANPTTERRLQALAKIYNLSKVEELSVLIAEAADYAGVTL
jgi:hypothetical protein